MGQRQPISICILHCMPRSKLLTINRLDLSLQNAYIAITGFPDSTTNTTDYDVTVSGSLTFHNFSATAFVHISRTRSKSNDAEIRIFFKGIFCNVLDKIIVIDVGGSESGVKFNVLLNYTKSGNATKFDGMGNVTVENLLDNGNSLSLSVYTTRKTQAVKLFAFTKDM